MSAKCNGGCVDGKITSKFSPAPIVCPVCLGLWNKSVPSLPPANRVMTRAEFDALLAAGWTCKPASLYEVDRNRRVVNLWMGNNEPRIFIEPRRK